MMNPEQRINYIQEQLTKVFTPIELKVIDDSEKHRGHAGSKDGAGHYTIIIKSPHFQNLSRIQAHREIYAALNDLIPHEIHALSINIIL